MLAESETGQPPYRHKKKKQKKISGEEPALARKGREYGEAGGVAAENDDETLSPENQATTEIQNAGQETVRKTVSRASKSAQRYAERRKTEAGEKPGSSLQNTKVSSERKTETKRIKRKGTHKETLAIEAKTESRPMPSKKVQAKGLKGMKQTAAVLKRKLESKALLPLLAGGGGVVLVAVLICLLIGVAGSGFGLLFAETDGETTIPGIVRDIEKEYTETIETICREHPHDTVEISGSRTDFQTVFALYGALHTGENLVSVDAKRAEEIQTLFWRLNTVDYTLKKQTETRFTETVLPNGEIEEKPNKVLVTCLQIKTKTPSVAVMKKEFLQTEQQRKLFDELQSGVFDGAWGAALYGLDEKQETLAAAALREVGNVGGQPYWSWYGFKDRVDWCACFVSFCADKCGYIERGLCPKFAGCHGGQTWFSEHGKWVSREDVVQPGMIIFYDFEEDGVRDKLADHVGVVTAVSKTEITTVEGNWDDRCVRKTLSINDSDILGYGRIG